MFFGEKQILVCFYFTMKMYCDGCSLESTYWEDSNDYPQHVCMEEQYDIPPVLSYGFD